MNKKLTKIHDVLALVCALMLTTAFILLMLDGAQNAAVIIAAILLPFTLLHYVLARGVSNGNTWARRASQVIAVPILFIFPIGTFVGGSMLMCAGSVWETRSD